MYIHRGRRIDDRLMKRVSRNAVEVKSDLWPAGQDALARPGLKQWPYLSIEIWPEREGINGGDLERASVAAGRTTRARSDCFLKRRIKRGRGEES